MFQCQRSCSRWAKIVCNVVQAEKRLPEKREVNLIIVIYFYVLRLGITLGVVSKFGFEMTRAERAMNGDPLPLCGHRRG